jgi:uncharacterized MAPEG superfamily protein
MTHVSMNVLIGLTAWTLILLILMEVLRGRLALTKAVAANAFKPDNSNLSPFMQRLARAHANCVESLPVFSALLIAALISGRTGITDPLAPWLFAARVVQSCAHLASLSVPAVYVRFVAFAARSRLPSTGRGRCFRASARGRNGRQFGCAAGRSP